MNDDILGCREAEADNAAIKGQAFNLDAEHGALSVHPQVPAVEYRQAELREIEADALVVSVGNLNLQGGRSDLSDHLFRNSPAKHKQGTPPAAKWRALALASRVGLAAVHAHHLA